MASAAEQVGNMICGEWVHDRDENIISCMKGMGYADDVANMIAGTKPVMKVVRDGETFTMTYEMFEGKAHTYSFKLGETVDVVDKDHTPPLFHNKETFTLEDGKLKIIAYSQLAEGPLKVDTQTYIERKGDELYSYMMKIGDANPSGSRIMKLKK